MFQRFQFIVIDSLDSGPEVRQNHGGWEHIEEAVHLMVDRRQRKGIQEWARARYSPKDTSAVTYFLLGPASSQECYCIINLSTE
jgi:hypothetical protein